MDIQQYHALPQPDEIPLREREDAMGAYLMMFASLAMGLPLPIINLIAAVIYYFLNRKKSRFVQFHCLQSLLSQIPITILNAVVVFWFVLILFQLPEMQFSNEFIAFVLTVALANLIYIAFSIIAAVKARKGIFYYFIFFGVFSYKMAFAVKDGAKDIEHNKPPKF